MGQIKQPSDVLLITAVFSRHEDALAWARERAETTWGPIALESPRFDFEQTAYYQPTMGPGLKKVFWAFDRLVSPGRLAAIKLETNAWEDEYAALGRHIESRPLNLDPGYIALGKLVLASTKDHAHRIYLDQGIFAEVTLFYKFGAWREHPWTFADYREPAYHRFFDECRRQLQSTLPPAGPRQ